MAKLTGTIRINANPGKFEVAFVPYSGRLNSKPVTVSNLDDLVALLMNLKMNEDEATRWAGKARTQGVVLIPSIAVTDAVLKENGLLE